MSLSLLQSYESDSSEDDERPCVVSGGESRKHQESSKSGSVGADEPDGEASEHKGYGKVRKDESDFESLRQKAEAPPTAPPTAPPDLLRELKAAGRGTADINIVDINPTPVSNQPHPSSHIPRYALRNNAMRLARHITKESVSSIARRKHQITALAAEAVALQVAQDTMPGATRPGSRMNGKFK